MTSRDLAPLITPQMSKGLRSTVILPRRRVGVITQPPVGMIDETVNQEVDPPIIDWRAKTLIRHKVKLPTMPKLVVVPKSTQPTTTPTTLPKTTISPKPHIPLPVIEPDLEMLGKAPTGGIDDEGFQLIRIDEIPTNDKWRYVTMYRNSATGAMLYWWNGFDGVDRIVREHGQVGGQPIPSDLRVEPVGGKTMQQQALQKARREYLDKIKEGYQPPGATEARLFKPMLSKKYEPKRVTTWPVWVQPKYNGVRMLAQNIGDGKITTRSRANNYYNHLGHVTDELKDFFQYLPPYATLDGEMYNHDMELQEISGIMRAQVNINPKVGLLQYVIFDVIYDPPEPYNYRYNMLVNAFNRYLDDGHTNTSFIIAPVDEAYTHREIEQKFNEKLEQGYEGLMIKKIYKDGDSQKDYNDTLYQANKRPWSTMKYKPDYDEEGTVVDVDAARGTEEGAAMLYVQDKRGNVLRMRFRVPIETRRYWFQHPETVIGKQATFRYQDLSIDNVPQHFRGVAIRDYE